MKPSCGSGAARGCSALGPGWKCAPREELAPDVSRPPEFWRCPACPLPTRSQSEKGNGQKLLLLRSSGQEPAALGAAPQLPERLQCAKNSSDVGVRPAQKCLRTPAAGWGRGAAGAGGTQRGSVLALLSPRAVRGVSGCWHRGAGGEHPSV